MNTQLAPQTRLHPAFVTLSPWELYADRRAREAADARTEAERAECARREEEYRRQEAEDDLAAAKRQCNRRDW